MYVAPLYIYFARENIQNVSVHGLLSWSGGRMAQNMGVSGIVGYIATNILNKQNQNVHSFLFAYLQNMYVV